MVCVAVHAVTPTALPTNPKSNVLHRRVTRWLTHVRTISPIVLITIVASAVHLPLMKQVAKYVNHAAARTIALKTSTVQEASALLTGSVELTSIASIQQTRTL
jgi:hypothetical protein